jgi:hypothetical protein
MYSGKWYWEVTVTSIGSGGANEVIIGIGTSAAALGNYIGADAFGWGYDSSGQKQHAASGPAYGASYTTGAVIGVALDLTAGTLTFYKNGVSQGTAYTGLSGPFFAMTSGGGNAILTCNFGQSAFAYTVPTGFNTGLVPNYAMLNPADKSGVTTLSGGNLVATTASTGGWANVRATQGLSSGKWYWEATITAIGGLGQAGVGVATSGAALTLPLGNDANGWAYYNAAQKEHGGSAPSYGATWTTGDVIGVALDMGSGSITFYKNGVSQGVAYSSGITGTVYPAFGGTYSTTGTVFTCNFGQNAFAYTPPAGYSAVGLASTGSFTVSATGSGSTTVTITDALSATTTLPLTVSIPNLQFTVHPLVGSDYSVPAGVFVRVKRLSNSTIPVLGYLSTNGVIPAILYAGESYTATFTAPDGTKYNPVTFTATGVTQTVLVTLPYVPPAPIVTPPNQDLANLISLFPQSWADSTAYNPATGGLATLFGGVSATHDALLSESAYVSLQTRLLTSTDDNLEQRALDYLGAGFGRTEVLVGNNLVLETDAEYAQRIQKAIIESKVTVAGIQQLVQEYIDTYYLVDSVLNVRLLGLDVEGGLDTWGGLDGRAISTPPLPKVTVFDLQSDPAKSAIVGLTDSQFCLLFTYGGLTLNGFFAGYTYLSKTSYLADTNIRVLPPLSPGLAAFVNSIKAVGTVPVYADNRSA